MKKIAYLMLAMLFILSACKKDEEDTPEKPPTVPNLSEPFIKGQNELKTIYPINLTANNYSEEELFMLTILQGIVAKYSDTQLYFYSTQDNDYYPPDNENNDQGRTSSLLIMNYLKNSANTTVTAASNPSTNAWDIVDDFKQYLDGFVVYSDYNGWWQRDITNTACGILNCIPVTADLVAEAQSHGLSQKEDFSQSYWYGEFISNYLQRINPLIFLELDQFKANGPRDYAAMTNCMVFYAHGNATLRYEIMNTINTANVVPVFGWDDKDANPDIAEYNIVNSVSITGNFVVASDQSMNLSTLASSGSAVKQFTYSAPPAPTYDSNKVYVAYIMSDGDNLQLMTNHMNTKVWFGSPYREEFPVGWTMPAAMYYLEPDVWNMYIEKSEPTDEFLLGPSTIGYCMGNVITNSGDFAIQLDYLDKFLNLTGIRTMMVFGDHVKQPHDWENYTYLDGILNCANLDGIFYKAYDDNSDVCGKFVEGKPVAHFNFIIDPTQQGDMTIMQQAEWNAQKIQLAAEQTPGERSQEPWTSMGFFPIYGVRNHTPGDFNKNDLMGAFKRLNDLIEAYNSNYADPPIVVVYPSQMLDLMNQSKAELPGYWYSH